MKKITLTGDPLHLGHYVGSLQNRVKLQHEYALQQKALRLSTADRSTLLHDGLVGNADSAFPTAASSPPSDLSDLQVAAPQGCRFTSSPRNDRGRSSQQEPT